MRFTTLRASAAVVAFLAVAAVADVHRNTNYDVSFGEVVSVAGEVAGPPTRVFLRNERTGRRRRVVLATTPAPAGTAFAFTVPAVRSGNYLLDVRLPGVRTLVEVPYTNVFVASPAVASLEPTFGLPGTSVTVSGRAFGTKRGRVRLGSRQARVLAWSDTAITFVVPKLSMGLATLRIRNAAGTSGARPGDFAVGTVPVPPREVHLRFTAGARALDARAGDRSNGSSSQVTAVDRLEDGARTLGVFLQHFDADSTTSLVLQVALPQPFLLLPYRASGADVAIAFGPFEEISPEAGRLFYLANLSGMPAAPPDDVEFAIRSIADGFIEGSFRGTLRPTPGAADPAPIPIEGTFRAPYVQLCDASAPCDPVPR